MTNPNGCICSKTAGKVVLFNDKYIVKANGSPCSSLSIIHWKVMVILPTLDGIINHSYKPNRVIMADLQMSLGFIGT